MTGERMDEIRLRTNCNMSLFFIEMKVDGAWRCLAIVPSREVVSVCGHRRCKQ